MMEGYKKTSIGDIPEEWELLKLVEICDVRDGTHDSPKYQQDGIPFVTSKNLTDTELSFDDIKYITKEDHVNFSKRSHVENGDILFGMIGTVGKPVIVNEVFEFSIKNVALLKFSQAKSLNNVYALNILKSSIVENQFRKMSNGGVLKFVALGNIRSLLFPLPPLPEQQKIADILSTVDAKIEVIDQQINETQELKKGLMQRLLTKGIGHTEFKDSPLGEIPVGWEVVKSGEVFELIHGYQFRDYDFTEKGLPIVKIGQINRNGQIDMNGCSYFSVDRAEEFANKRIYNGDVLMALTGATLGKSCWVEGLDDAVYQNYRVGKFVPHDENILSKQFLYFLIGSPLALNQILSKINSGAQGNVGKSDFVKLKITLPPIVEQQKIADILSSVDEKLEVLSKKKTTYQELKKGLMQQLLTGLVRVKV